MLIGFAVIVAMVLRVGLRLKNARRSFNRLTEDMLKVWLTWI